MNEYSPVVFAEKSIGWKREITGTLGDLRLVKTESEITIQRAVFDVVGQIKDRMYDDLIRQATPTKETPDAN